MKELISILFLVTPLFSYSQYEKAINEIESNTKWINTNIQLFEIKNLIPPGESTDGGELTKYFYQEHVVKIIEKYYGETGNIKVEYYLRNDSLSFITAQTLHYNMPYYIDSVKANELEFNDYFKPYLTDTIENQLFFQNNQLFKLVNSKKGIIAKKEPFFSETGDKYYSWFQKVK